MVLNVVIKRTLTPAVPYWNFLSEGFGNLADAAAIAFLSAIAAEELEMAL